MRRLIFAIVSTVVLSGSALSQQKPERVLVLSEAAKANRVIILQDVTGRGAIYQGREKITDFRNVEMLGPNNLKIWDAPVTGLEDKGTPMPTPKPSGIAGEDPKAPQPKPNEPGCTGPACPGGTKLRENMVLILPGRYQEDYFPKRLTDRAIDRLSR